MGAAIPKCLTQISNIASLSRIKQQSLIFIEECDASIALYGSTMRVDILWRVFKVTTSVTEKKCTHVGEGNIINSILETLSYSSEIFSKRNEPNPDPVPPPIDRKSINPRKLLQFWASWRSASIVGPISFAPSVNLPRP